MSITVIVEKGNIRLPDDVKIPDGTRVRLEIDDQPASRRPPDYFQRTAGAFAGEEFERPDQGELQVRDDW